VFHESLSSTDCNDRTLVDNQMFFCCLCWWLCLHLAVVDVMVSPLGNICLLGEMPLRYKEVLIFLSRSHVFVHLLAHKGGWSLATVEIIGNGW